MCLFYRTGITQSSKHIHSVVQRTGLLITIGPGMTFHKTLKIRVCYLRNNSWKPYVYIVFTTVRPLCQEVLPRAFNKRKIRYSNGN
jgi:hypothetical protein